MTSGLLRDVIEGQRREWERRLQEPFVQRDVPAVFDRAGNLIRVIIGPRRSGKSFFALHRLARESSRGYINFDDERLVDLKNYDELVAAVDHVYGRADVLLLDEIQNLPKWELFVNRLQRQGRRLVVTGSNSKLLSRELSTHLSGRYLEVVLLPFSFAEVLRAESRTLTSAEVQSRWIDYQEKGGYPEPLLKHVDAGEYLRTLVDAVLYRDIVQRYRIRQTEGLNQLAKFLFSNVAKEFSYHSAAKMIGARSAATVQKFAGFLETAFLFFFVPRFSFKVREQAAYNKKVYAIDNGMATSLGFRFSADTGRLAENAVAIHLWRACKNRGSELFYWKSAQGDEVDFVIKSGRQVHHLIQVCWRLEEPKVKEREIRALLKAGNELRCSRLLLLTAEEEAEETFSWFGLKGTVRFIPIWKWLLPASDATLSDV